MRRIEKENLKLFRRLGLYDHFMEIREMSVESIIFQREHVTTEPFYQEGGARVRALVGVFYCMSLKHAYGKEKALSQHKA